MTLRSMTGFAAREGTHGALSWRWEMRSVNARGLDIRWRGPEGRDEIEPAIRAAAAARFTRGNVSIALRLSERPEAAAPRFALNAPAVDALLAAAIALRDRVEEAGLAPAPLSLDALLAQKGVLERAEPEDDPELRAAENALILADGEAALDALAQMRADEGAELTKILAAQVDRIEALTREAAAAAAERAAAQGPALRRRLSAILSAAGQPLEEGRLAQELAILAVKGDVTEELDRLHAHVAAARALAASGAPAGRKLDFLTQEFNREANTLCSKADFAALTEAGLELKTVIDRMREQVQNIE
ncbi:YicC/YloC family endoribonuclease [Rhodovulum sp. DZ06]|uniref:YicC/YloC family endoribonuclease n=1 Tax=Rhodovulum sp. DZ06 TaxID=3425126 RepID=UPI003D32CF61